MIHSRRPSLAATCGLSAVLTALSCSDADIVTIEEADALGQLSEPLFVQSAVTWPTNRIDVCWQGVSGFSTEKAWVRTAIQGSWQQSSALRFGGWGTCPATSNGIRIGVRDAESLSRVGVDRQETRDFGFTPSTPNVWLNFTYVNFSTGCTTAREECIRADAVHEFGHAIGIFHEQLRSDPPGTADPACVKFLDSYPADFHHVGNWDPRSVMNYCNPVRSNLGRLSETDKMIARYYGRPNFFADVDGDGKYDAIAMDSTQVVVRLSNRSNGFGNGTQWSDIGFSGSHGTFFADVTGDGRADGIVVNSNKVTVRRSNGFEFEPNESWTTNRFYGTYGTFIADVTGDRRADLIGINPGIITVRPSTGSGFAANQNWLLEEIPESLHILFGDVDGDVDADLVVVGPDTTYVYKSSGGATGGSFGPALDFTLGPYYGDLGTFLADVTGDTRDDLIVVNRNSITVRRSTGNIFTANETWSSNAYYGIDHGTFFANVASGTVSGFPNSFAVAIAVNDVGIFVRKAATGAFSTLPEKWSGPFYGAP